MVKIVIILDFIIAIMKQTLPNSLTNTTDGEKQGNDEISCTKAHYGDQCLCLETSEVYELRNEPNDWKKL